MGKRKRKVKLPCDRNGTPINVGDWLMFDDGPFHVDTLLWCGYGLDLVTTDGWVAVDEDGRESDNLGAGVIITYPKGDK